jgi:hypothetical protein
MCAKRNLLAVAHEFVGQANAVLAGTNQLLHMEHELAKQVLAKEHELGALRQRSAILSRECTDFRDRTEKLKAVHAAKVSTRIWREFTSNYPFVAFGMLRCHLECTGHILQAKELIAVETELLEATKLGSEQSTGQAPQSGLQPPSCHQPKQEHGTEQPFPRYQQQQPDKHALHGSGTDRVTPTATAVLSQPAIKPNWAPHKPDPATQSKPSGSSIHTAGLVPTATTTAHQTVHHRSTHETHPPVTAAYTVEEPDSDDSPVPEPLRPNGTNANIHAGFQSSFPSALRDTQFPPAGSWCAAPAGVQDDATHVLMRKVECKRNLKGVPTARKMRVREVYTRIDPQSGDRQSLAAERNDLSPCLLATALYRSNCICYFCTIHQLLPVTRMIVDECKHCVLLAGWWCSVATTRRVIQIMQHYLTTRRPNGTDVISRITCHQK